MVTYIENSVINANVHDSECQGNHSKRSASHKIIEHRGYVQRVQVRRLLLCSSVFVSLCVSESISIYTRDQVSVVVPHRNRFGP